MTFFCIFFALLQFVNVNIVVWFFLLFVNIFELLLESLARRQCFCAAVHRWNFRLTYVASNSIICVLQTWMLNKRLLALFSVRQPRWVDLLLGWLGFSVTCTLLTLKLLIGIHGKGYRLHQMLLGWLGFSVTCTLVVVALDRTVGNSRRHDASMTVSQ